MSSQIDFEVGYEKGLKAYRDAVENGDIELAGYGFQPLDRPNINGIVQDRPTFAADLNSMSQEELLTQLGIATAWYEYAMDVLPYVVSERNAAESAKAFAWAKIRQHKEGTVQDKDDQTIIDDRYIKANSYYETCDFKYRKVKAICDGLMREIETISRALTGKGQINDASGLSHAAQARAARAGHGPKDYRGIHAQFEVRGHKEHHHKDGK